MKQFILLLKGKEQLDYSEEKLQERISEYRRWVAEIEPIFVSDNRLERVGTWIQSKEEINTDGPFLESKEIIAGYIILKSKSLQEATIYASGCPLIKYFEIFVRPIA